jgi:hypothetical protein
MYHRAALLVAVLLATCTSAAWGADPPDEWSPPRPVSKPGQIVTRSFLANYASSWIWKQAGVVKSTVNYAFPGAAPGLLPEPFLTNERGDKFHAAYQQRGRIFVRTAAGDELTVADGLRRPKHAQFASDFDEALTVVWQTGRKAFIATGDADGGFTEPQVLASGRGIRHLKLQSYIKETAVAWERNGRIYARWRFASDSPFRKPEQIGIGRTTKIDIGYYDAMGIGWTAADRAVLVTKKAGAALRKRTLARGDINGIGVQNGTVSWAANGRVERWRFSPGRHTRCLVALGDAHVWDSNGEDTAYTMDGNLYVNDTLIDAGGEYRQVQQDASSVVSWITADDKLMESRWGSGTGDPNCLN